MRAAPAQSRLTPLAEAAAALQQDYWKLWAGVVGGRIPHVRIGGRLFLRASVLREMLERRTESAEAAS
jgi:hypothetical protein